MIKVVHGIPELNSYPLNSVVCDDVQIMVDLDDRDGTRFKLIFMPYQAMRMITTDCFILADNVDIASNSVMEMINSRWLEELKINLNSKDHDANFLDESKHYILPLGDNFLEVIAWDIKVEYSN